ncbi:acyltransferase [Bradyrhizobium sp. 177]|uniref:acyltransferase n=1 Tax=Bradyrhizobium sp. 177 TaxID=2782647 RepID=UPI001FFA132E|nr:hypothetical protein [Bradyrhizobium sp. 177]MCK1550847.1 acyltransferase [Bradyrhizobium sp. 177]
MKLLASLLILLLPWRLRRLVLQSLFGYEIDPQATVGFSIILAKKVVLRDRSRIGHLTFVKGLDELSLGRSGRLGNLNWITGYSSSNESTGRYSALFIGDHAAVTHRHLLDCADRISIGNYSTVAGWNTQFITHSIDLRVSRQTSMPIRVGKYCFVGSRSLLLKGAELPDYSILGAGAVLTEKLTEEFCIYGGVPARKVGVARDDLEYFRREVGFVD